MIKHTLNHAKLRHLGFSEKDIQALTALAERGSFDKDPPENLMERIIKTIKDTSIRLAGDCLKRGVSVEEAMMHVQKCEACRKNWDEEMEQKNRSH